MRSITPPVGVEKTLHLASTNDLGNTVTKMLYQNVPMKEKFCTYQEFDQTVLKVDRLPKYDMSKPKVAHVSSGESRDAD